MAGTRSREQTATGAWVFAPIIRGRGGRSEGAARVFGAAGGLAGVGGPEYTARLLACGRHSGRRRLADGTIATHPGPPGLAGRRRGRRTPQARRRAGGGGRRGGGRGRGGGV